ncbi:MAG: response regulator [Candidatus Cloacimonadota bacterium]|nr:MAG: response regulator [Candidatus Cloacimonadota bacterium]
MKKILIIDDEKDCVLLLSEILEYENFEVDTSTSGLEALDKLKSNSYALIITDIMMPDIMMPDMDGIALIEIILAKYKSTRVIIMSGWFDQSELQHLHDKNPQFIKAVLTKPFSPIFLKETIIQELDKV